MSRKSTTDRKTQQSTNVSGQNLELKIWGVETKVGFTNEKNYVSKHTTKNCATIYSFDQMPRTP